MKEKIIHISTVLAPIESQGDYFPEPRIYGLGNQGNLYILIEENGKAPRWELYVSCDNIG